MSYRDDGLDLDAIRRINNTVVNDDGTVKSFKEQLLEYEYGYYNSRVSVNEFLSVYERANIEFTIRKTWEKGLNLYPNEKSKSWIQSLGCNCPERYPAYSTEATAPSQRTGGFPYRTLYQTRRQMAIPMMPVIRCAPCPMAHGRPATPLRAATSTCRDVTNPDGNSALLT